MSFVSRNLSVLLFLAPAIFSSSVIFASDASKAVKGKKDKLKAGQSKIEDKEIDNEAKPSSDKSANKSDSQSNGSRSTDIRARQVANVDILYTPVSGFLLSFGGGASYNVKPDLALGIQYLTGSKTIHDEMTDNVITVKADATLQGSAGYVYGRYFIGNSFNMMAGLGVRTATIKYTMEEESLNLKLNGKIEIQSITVPVFIGNRWTFQSGFTLGCDWIGAFIPLTGSAKSTLDGNLPNSLITELNDKFVSDGNDLAHKTSLTLLLTSVGWAF